MKHGKLNTDPAHLYQVHTDSVIFQQMTTLHYFHVHFVTYTIRYDRRV